MSASVIFFKNDTIVLATDTLLFREAFDAENLEKKPSLVYVGNSGKSTFVPNYKSVIVCMGTRLVSVCLDNYIKSLYGSGDITDLVEEIAEGFYDTIDFSPLKTGLPTKVFPGCIQVFGYCEREQLMHWYVINVSCEKVIMCKKEPLNGSVYTIPAIKDKKVELEICQRGDISIHGILIELMKQQYNECYPEAQSDILIGGEIMITSILSKPAFSVTFEFPHQFENFALSKACYKYLKRAKNNGNFNKKSSSI